VSCPAVQTGSPGAGAHVYRPRRPEKTLLHKTVRQNLETYLVASDEQDDFRGRVPLHVEAALPTLYSGRADTQHLGNVLAVGSTVECLNG